MTLQMGRTTLHGRVERLVREAFSRSIQAIEKCPQRIIDRFRLFDRRGVSCTGDHHEFRPANSVWSTAELPSDAVLCQVCTQLYLALPTIYGHGYGHDREICHGSHDLDHDLYHRRDLAWGSSGRTRCCTNCLTQSRPADHRRCTFCSACSNASHAPAEHADKLEYGPLPQAQAE
jgi:hypothetical protein